jgi:DNA-directed RNA polymerase subunit F
VGELVQRVYGGTGSWTDTLKKVLDLEPSIEESLRSLWERNKVIASQASVELHPIQFAKMIVDANFAELIGSELNDGQQS